MPTHWTPSPSLEDGSQLDQPPQAPSSWLRPRPEHLTGTLIYLIAAASALASAMAWVGGISASDLRLNIADGLSGLVRALLGFVIHSPGALVWASLLTEIFVAVAFAALGLLVRKRGSIAFFLAVSVYAFDAVIALPFGLWSSFFLHATLIVGLVYLRRQWSSSAA